MKATEEPVVWAHEDAPFTGAQVRDLLAENARLRAMNDANERWIEETWPTIEDKALGDLVRERDEALAEVSTITRERDRLRTALGYWEGQHFDRVVRDRDENEEIAKRALATGLQLADLARLAGLTAGFSIEFDCCPSDNRD